MAKPWSVRPNTSAGTEVTRFPFESPNSGIWLAILAAFGFSLKAVLVKLAYAQPTDTPIAPITMLALRMVFALPVFCLIGWRELRQANSLSGRDWAELVALGLLGYYGAVMLDFMGLQYVSASLERLIAYTYPTFVLLLGAYVFRKRIQRREWLALLLCYGGIATAFSHDLESSADPKGVWIGSASILASSLSYAVYLVYGGNLIQRIGPSRFTALAMLVSSAATMIHFAATQPLSSLMQPWRVYALGIALGLASTVLPVFALSLAIRRIGASRAALVGCVGPLMTMYLSCWFLDEPMTMLQMLGALFVIVGVLVVGRQ